MKIPRRKEKREQIERLLKERYEILHQMILDLNSADARKFGRRANIAQLLKFVPSVAEPLLPIPKLQLLRPPPREIRAMIHDIPVAFIWGEKDVFFSPDQAAARMGNLSKVYPSASVIFNARVADWPHEAIATNAPKFASIVMDITRRMEDMSKKRGDEAPAEIKLYY